MNTIHNAIERRNFLQFDILVKQKVGLDTQDKLGLTPLMKSCHEPNRENAREMIRLLLKHGASIKVLDNLGMNVLLHGTLAKNVSVLDLLLESGEYDPTFRDIKGNTALHIAAAVGNMDCVVRLVEHVKSYNLKVDLRNDAGFTALLIACCQGNVPVARYLFQQGASLNARDSEHNRSPDDWIRVSRAVPNNISIFNPESGDYFPTHEEVAEPEPPEEWYGARVYIFLKDAPELCLQEASEKVINRARMTKTQPRDLPHYATPFTRSVQERRIGSYHSPAKTLRQKAMDTVVRTENPAPGNARNDQPGTPIHAVNTFPARRKKQPRAPSKSHDSGVGDEMEDCKASRTQYGGKQSLSASTDEAESGLAESNTSKKGYLQSRKNSVMTCKMPGLHARSRSAGLPSRRSAPELRQEYCRTQSNFYGCTCSDSWSNRYFRPFSSPAWQEKDSWRTPHDMKSVLTIDDMSNLRSAKSTAELKESESDPKIKGLLDNLIRKFHIRPRPMTVGPSSMRIAHVRRSSAPGVAFERPKTSLA